MVSHGAWIAMLLVVLAGNLACDAGKSQSQGPVTPATAQATDKPPARPAEPDYYEASGPIVVENQVDVAAQRNGVVTSILADVGQFVHKGGRLALLDDRQSIAERDAAAATVRSIEADVRNWDAEVKVLEADLERAQKMWDAQIITKEQLDHARYKLIADRYELEREQHNLQKGRDHLRSLELELEKTRIVAPFHGIVARRYVRVGQQVAPGDRLFWVTAVSPLRVKFTLPENFLDKIKKGQQVTVFAAEGVVAPHPAKVIQISPVVDPSSDTIEVLAELVGRAVGLRPGMTARVRIEKQQ